MGAEAAGRTATAATEHPLTAIESGEERAPPSGDTGEQRRTERVRLLLQGEPLDASELAYELDAHHVGLAASGRNAGARLRSVLDRFDRRLLLVRPDDRIWWGWLGGRHRFCPDELQQLGRASPAGIVLAFGEPAEGLSGWRLTHRQAAAALTVARRGTPATVHYADVALLAAALQDELLRASLRRLYLEPLDIRRDRGPTLRATLRAYLAAGRNVSSAAAALGTRRQTVAQRLREIEGRLDRPLDACLNELELALRLDELGDTRP